MNEDKLQSATVRANRANALLNDELFVEAVDTVTRAYLDRLMATDMRDQDLRERLWHRIQALADVKKHLSTVVSGGRLAQKEIDMLAEKETRRRTPGAV